MNGRIKQKSVLKHRMDSINPADGQEKSPVVLFTARTIKFHKLCVCSSLANQVSASQETLCSIRLINQTVMWV